MSARSPGCRSTAIQALLLPLLACILFASPPAGAQGNSNRFCNLPDYEPSLRPDADGTPTIVSVGLLIADLIAINDVEQNVVLDALLTLGWTDHRLDNVAGCRFGLGQVWSPSVLLINAGDIHPRQPPELVVRPGGQVVFTARYDASILTPWNMKNFPFDAHEIVVQLASLQDDLETLRFEVAESWTGRRPVFSIPDWQVGEPQATATSMSLPRLGFEVPVFEMRVSAARLSSYYVYKFVFPLCLIVMMSWAVFWIDPAQLGPQLSLSATSMLTLIAYQFTMNDQLPRIAYFTRMDMYVLISSILVFSALVEALVTGSLTRAGRAQLAMNMDRACRWIFPSIFVATILFTLVLR